MNEATQTDLSVDVGTEQPRIEGFEAMVPLRPSDRTSPNGDCGWIWHQPGATGADVRRAEWIRNVDNRERPPCGPPRRIGRFRRDRGTGRRDGNIDAASIDVATPADAFLADRSGAPTLTAECRRRASGLAQAHDGQVFFPLAIDSCVGSVIAEVTRDNLVKVVHAGDGDSCTE